MIRPGDVLLGLANRRKRVILRRILFGPLQRKVELRDLDATHLVTRRFGGLRVSFRQCVPEAVAARVRISLDDRDPAGHGHRALAAPRDAQ